MGTPNFLCIGAQKAGTTWLHHMLKQHPDVWLPPIKEIHFFDRSLEKKIGLSNNLQRYKAIAAAYKKRLKTIDSDTYNYQLGYLISLTQYDFLTEDWYRRIFNHKTAREKISGEITPAYLDMDKAKVENAARMLKDAKFILIIRDPLARAVSQIRMTVERRKLTSVSEKNWLHLLKQINRDPRGLYHLSIPNWIDAVGQDRMLCLPFAQIKSEPKGLLEKIEDFIGASRFVDYAAAEEKVNVSQSIDIPDWVVAKLAKQTDPAKQFLIKKFGREFYERTR
ncbi:hypothetical protein M2360_004292 [Rhizobium sp. SG_E_25_P2]|uniref:sulfotransferase family protein n=1 Tax=Rhizobium sp. SG_E_25_P2 TaxID=2879942 RepID=UPI002474E62A|nr:sulfotransferase [Rhizobium sp. SG_E_25_P2]MDH6268873.1 hypothetical protein [Rhizobium sp. SG_E_25_P2]